jgi:heme A synthase
MQSVAAARGDAGDQLSRFRRLVTLTIIATFTLVLIGGVVRVSDSGLGCGAEGSGTHGWPLCQGGVLPADTSESIIEFSHRLAATVVTLLIVLMAWRAFRHLRAHKLLVRGSVAAGLLVVAQAALGGLTVEKGLEDELVAIHLGVAMLLLGLLFVLRRASSEQPAPAADSVRGLRTLGIVTSVLVLATIVAGGYVAGTEYHGTPEQSVVVGAHSACGTGWNTAQFPGCNGQGFLSFGQTRLADIQLTHRLFMYLTTISVLAFAALALRRRAPSRAFWIAPLILVSQIALGAINVWAGKHAGLIVGHLALGTTLWMTVVYATATLMPVPSPAPERLARPQATGAAPA